jgi:hypothetical protein
MLTVTPSGINLQCMMPCQSETSLSSDPARRSWSLAIMVASTLFGDHTGNTCDSLTEEVLFILCCVDKLTTDVIAPFVHQHSWYNVLAVEIYI